MATFTWSTGVSGDWATAAHWIGGVVPNADTAAVVIANSSSAYTTTVGASDSETINSLDFGGFSGANPTLEIAGTLTFAGTNPGITFEQGLIRVDSTGLLDGFAQGLFFIGPTVNFINNGTVRADAGANAALQILTTLTNNGTLIANNGLLTIGGAGISNLAGGTLTGGSYIAQGPTAGVFNQIEIGGNFDAIITVDDANIVLDGGASDIQGFSGGNFQPIEQQLQTIAAGGTLSLLSNRGYSTANSLDNAGIIELQGGTFDAGGLTMNATGTLDGFGVVIGGVTNQGAIVADGGALDITSAIGGNGVLGATLGSTMILNGATTGSLSDKGTVFEASGLLVVDGSLGGTGSLVVQNGATIEFFSGTPQNVTFSGSNATLQLDNFAGYHGTLVGFAKNDTIVLAGAAATNAHVSGSSLVVMDNGSTVDTIALAGSYAPGATFSVANVGGDAVVTNLSGAPLQQDFPFTVSLNDPSNLGGTLDVAFVNDLSAAAEDWAQYLTGHTTLRIQLNIIVNASGSELANAGPTTNIPSGTTLDGRSLDTPSSLIALTTGNYVPGIASDIEVNLPMSNLGSLFINPAPTPMPSGSVPDGELDLVTVFRHELGHGFGFGGLTTSGGSLGSQETLFDHFIQDVGGTIVFTGPHAEFAYGALQGTGIATPVPLTALAGNAEDFAHFANSGADPNATDLMSGLGLPPGTQRDISTMDLAVLQDVGAPITAGGVVCYARGTRIATPRGEVPVEELAIGDLVVTASGRIVPIIWVGRRRVDCWRHPRPEKVLPVRIRAHAFADGLPRRDLLVSPQHGFGLDGVLIPAKCLINGCTIVQQVVRTIEYFHVELSQHDLLLAEGAMAESYLDCGDRAMFDNGGRVMVLHPEFAGRIWDSLGCAELHLTGPVVEAVRRRLLAHARTLDDQSAPKASLA